MVFHIVRQPRVFEESKEEQREDVEQKLVGEGKHIIGGGTGGGGEPDVGTGPKKPNSFEEF